MPIIATFWEKPVFRYGWGECGYRISGLYRFSSFSGGETQINKYTDSQIYKQKQENPPPHDSVTWIWKKSFC